IAGFVTADGRKFTVAKGWGPTERDIAEAKRKVAEAAKAATQKTDKAVSDDKKAREDKKEDVDAKDGEGPKDSVAVEKPKVHKAGFRDEKADAVPVVTASANLDATRTTEATFLRRLHQGACSVFGTVLGPEANDAHRDHFHFDMKERRHSAICH